MTEIIVIGGTGAPARALPLYAPLLNSVPSTIPAKDRYFPLPHKGLGHVMSTQNRLSAQVREFASSFDEPPVIVGHSQGAVHAAILGLIGLASAVVSLAGPHGGVGSLRALEELSPAAADLDSRSHFIRTHKWALGRFGIHDVDIPFHTVNATVDQIVPRQFGITTSTRWWDAPKWVPGCCLRIPEGVQRLRSTVPSDHILLPLSSGVRWLVSGLAGEGEMGAAA